jgi:hypothetical protein
VARGPYRGAEALYAAARFLIPANPINAVVQLVVQQCECHGSTTAELTSCTTPWNLAGSIAQLQTQLVCWLSSRICEQGLRFSYTVYESLKSRPRVVPINLLSYFDRKESCKSLYCLHRFDCYWCCIRLSSLPRGFRRSVSSHLFWILQQSTSINQHRRAQVRLGGE